MKIKINTTQLLLLSIVIFSIILRFWLIDKRWINPDEGAHLMDAALILDGKIPGVDFVSRQPIYAFLNAIVLKFLGVNYIYGRLFPMTCSILVGFTVFFMALMLYDQKVAILSAAIYWLLPLELMNSVIVKTEPLVTLLTCLSLVAVIIFTKGNRKRWLIFAGIFAAMGFYVRQSALIIPLVVLGYLLIYHKKNYYEITKCLAYFIMGYISVILLVLIYYIRFTSFSEFIMSDLSPFGFLALAGKKLFSIIGGSVNTTNDVALNIAEISNSKYTLFHNYILQAVKLHSFLIVGLVLSLITYSRRFFSKTNSERKALTTAYPLLYLWVFLLFIAYTYYYYTSSFYIDYFREFLPPLTIIFSAWLCSFISNFKEDTHLKRLIIGGLSLSAIIFVIEWYFKKNLGANIIVGLPTAVFTFFYFSGDFESRKRKVIFRFSLLALIIIILLSRYPPLIPYFSGIMPKLLIIGVILYIPLGLLAKNTRPTFNGYMKFVSYCVILGTFVLSFSHAANHLSLSYDSLWSPEALNKTSQFLERNTQSKDTIMSGAVIWELQSLRRPFMNISHPLSFEHNVSKKDRERIDTALQIHPPEVIILDSRTEKTYFRQFPYLWDLLDANYGLVYTAEPARKPVKIYMKNK